MDTTPLPAREYETGERTYDLYFTAGGPGVFFRKANRGAAIGAPGFVK